MTAGIAYPWGFYAFAVAAVLAVVALSLVPAHLDPVRLEGCHLVPILPISGRMGSWPATSPAPVRP